MYANQKFYLSNEKHRWWIVIVSPSHSIYWSCFVKTFTNSGSVDFFLCFFFLNRYNLWYLTDSLDYAAHDMKYLAWDCRVAHHTAAFSDLPGSGNIQTSESDLLVFFGFFLLAVVVVRSRPFGRSHFITWRCRVFFRLEPYNVCLIAWQQSAQSLQTPTSIFNIVLLSTRLPPSSL